MKKFIAEFKQFCLRGNVIDLAVGVIIGGAFQSIVNSVINDLIMPFVGLITGGINFSDQFIIIKHADEAAKTAEYATAALAKEAGNTVFAYGSFITAVINFVIMAFIIFLLVKLINRLTAKKEVVEEVVEEIIVKESDVDVLKEIRDILKEKNDDK